MTNLIIFVSITGPFVVAFAALLIYLGGRIDGSIKRSARRFEQTDKSLERDEELESLRKDISKLSEDHTRLEGRLEDFIASAQQPAA